MFLDEMPKELQKVYLGKDFIAGWQNKPGKVNVIILGTAPGFVGTSINRKPFCNSHSDKLLWKILNDSGFKNETFFITNLIKYPLQNNREPTETEINENKPALNQEILKHNPKIVICLGKNAMALFNLRTYEHRTDALGINFLAINHPGYYIRKPKTIIDVEKFLKSKCELLKA